MEELVEESNNKVSQDESLTYPKNVKSNLAHERKNVLSGKGEKFSQLTPARSAFTVFIFSRNVWGERRSWKQQRKVQTFLKKDGKNCGKKIQKHKTQHKKTQSFSFLWHYLHTQDDIKICKLHPVIRSKFAALTFHRSQTSSVSLQKLWKIEKNRKKSFFMTLPRLHQTELFLFNLNSLVRPPTHRLSHPLNSHPIYWLMLIFYVLLKHRKVVPMNNKKQTNFYFRYIYLFVSGGQKESQFHFRRTFATSSHLPQSLCIKIDPPTTPEKQEKTENFSSYWIPSSTQQ